METPPSSYDFQTFEGYNSVYLSFQFSFTIHSYHTRGQTFNNFLVPPCKNNSWKRIFYYWASKLWNNLPNDVSYNYKSISLNSFKEALTSL